MMVKKMHTNMRLSEAARALLEQLSDIHALSHTAIVEIAIREKAKRDGVVAPPRPTPALVSVP